ncbi:MAG: hypothetical protein OXC91_01320 [Rhodobacteraceae bacterium]|nr:hypothetical protein [Paracoccaceae bacterium]
MAETERGYGSDEWRERMARLEERMNTMDERYDKGWALLREDMAKRETRMLLAVAGMIGLAVTVLGILIGLPS